jgi:hypothetical protein
MQGIGFPVAGASPAAAKVLGRVIRHVGSRDVFPGTSCAVQEKQRDHQAILKQFLWIVGTDGRNCVDCISQPGLNFPEQQVFCGGIHVMVLWRRVETQKAPAGDLPSRRCLNEECESPRRAVVNLQSRKRGSRENWCFQKGALQ